MSAIPLRARASDARSTASLTCCCRWMSMVLRMVLPAEAQLPRRCGANEGMGWGESGSGSSRDSSSMSASRQPCSCSLRRSLSLFSFSLSRFFPGCMEEGLLASTARVAASAQDSSEGGRPKYLHEAASSPTTFPPKGAWDAYMASILSLVHPASSLRASRASTPFCQRVRGLLREMRITCMVMVLPPEVMCPALMLPESALTRATGFTPGWW